jgi:hypothetical protein
VFTSRRSGWRKSDDAVGDSLENFLWDAMGHILN